MNLAQQTTPYLRTCSALQEIPLHQTMEKKYGLTEAAGHYKGFSVNKASDGASASFDKLWEIVLLGKGWNPDVDLD